MAATALPAFDRVLLARFLCEASGAGNVGLTEPTLLAGGAIRENWGFDAEFIGGSVAGRQRLVLRTDAATGIAASLGRVEEFAVLRAAFEGGVTAPEPLWACAEPDVIGKPFFVMRRVAGTAQGRRITTDPALEPALPAIAARLGRELARLQAIRPPCPGLAFLPSIDAATHIAGFRAHLDRHPGPRPVLEWAISWLERNIPEPLPPVLCHRDFRTGNYMLDGTELTGILDWEFAGWGDPDEDIGWFCCKGWRFARLDREAGGIADRAAFYDAYEAASGRRLDPQRVRFWEVLANVRWAVMALEQSDRHLVGGARDLSTAIIGRRATECELELLMLLDPDEQPRRTPSPPSGASGGLKGQPVRQDPQPSPTARYRKRSPLSSGAGEGLNRDMPSGIALASLGREWLLDELLPLLPPEQHRNLRLVATAIAIAEREAAAGGAPAEEIRERLSDLYRGDDGSSPRVRGEREGAPVSAAPGGAAALLARFAADLRAGAFEPPESPHQGSQQCASRGAAARAILWRLTILKLREGNPGFLAANGFGEQARVPVERPVERARSHRRLCPRRNRRRHR